VSGLSNAVVYGLGLSCLPSFTAAAPGLAPLTLVEARTRLAASLAECDALLQKRINTEQRVIAALTAEVPPTSRCPLMRVLLSWRVA
jgi:hypothetical protein